MYNKSETYIQTIQELTELFCLRNWQEWPVTWPRMETTVVQTDQRNCNESKQCKTYHDKDHSKATVEEYYKNVTRILLDLKVLSVTIILLEPKVISLCHQYRARPALHPCSLIRLYTAGWPTSNSQLDFPNLINDNSKTERLSILLVKG